MDNKSATEREGERWRRGEGGKGYGSISGAYTLFQIDFVIYFDS